MPARLFVEQAWLKPDVGSPFKHTTKASHKDRMPLTEAAERGAEQQKVPTLAGVSPCIFFLLGPRALSHDGDAR